MYRRMVCWLEVERRRKMPIGLVTTLWLTWQGWSRTWRMCVCARVRV